MTALAVKSSAWIDVDPWEALQPKYKYTMEVIRHMLDELNAGKSAEESALTELHFFFQSLSLTDAVCCPSQKK
jgi:nicotinic acid mononucleotide adenylyltransferase